MIGKRKIGSFYWYINDNISHFYYISSLIIKFGKYILKMAEAAGTQHCLHLHLNEISGTKTVNITASVENLV